MDESKSRLVEHRLTKPDLHEQWKKDFRTVENEKFYEQAFDYIVSVLGAPKNSTILDAGCGSCAHSVRLAGRGFFVQAVDFSETVLENAKANVKAKGLEDKIRIQRENILALSFEDKSFDYILCWGVLMHIPDLNKAISELARVIRPAGILVISEANMHSLQSIVLHNLRRLFRKGRATLRKTPTGMEYWIDNADGLMLTRQSNIKWLIKRFNNDGFTVITRLAGQFTEIYTRISSRLMRRLIHAFNRFWFKYIKLPHLAFGNVIILRKQK